MNEHAKNENLTSREIDFISDIRSEAEEVKDCYTRFSFQSWVFTIAALGIIFRLQLEFPLVGLLSVLPITLLLAVGRIGIHKYTTANRLYGFELYMNRRKRIEATRAPEVIPHRSVGWEEAYYAWRVTQASVYRCIYQVGKQPNSFLPVWGDKINFRHPAFHNSPLLWVKWSDDVVLYPGSYLKLNFFIMYLFCAMCTGPMIFMCLQLLVFGDIRNNGAAFFGNADHILGWFAVLVTLVSMAVIALRQRKLDARRKILETGLLSINSCAFMWNVVVHAHFRALSSLRDEQTKDISNFSGYTTLLAKETETITKLLLNDLQENTDPLSRLYDWMEQGPNTKIEVTP